MPDQVVTLPFGTGLDTKTSSKAVRSPKVISLLDGIFTHPEEIGKRNGYDNLNLSIEGGGTITSPLLSQSYNSELLVADGASLYSYSPSAGTGLFVNKGIYQSVSVTDKEISTYSPAVPGAETATGPTLPSLAVLGNYSLYSYVSDDFVFVSVMDNVSQSFLLQDFSISGAAGPAGVTSKSMLLSGTALAVVYNDISNNLYVQILTINSSGASFGSPVLIGSDVNPTTPLLEYSSGAINNYICYHYSSIATPDAIGIVAIDSSGSVVATTVFAISYVPGFIICQQDASNNAWFYWVNSTTPASEDIHYTVYAPALSSVILGDTIIASGVPNISRISSSLQISGNQFIYYSTNTQDSTSTSPSYVSTLYYEVSTSGVVSSANPFLLNVEIQSKWLNYNGINYSVFMNIPGVRNQTTRTVGIGQQNTYFLISESTRLSVSKTLFGKSVYDNGDGYIGDIVLSGATLLFAAQFIFFNDVENISSALTQVPLTGVMLVTFNFDDYEAYQSVLVGNVAVFNGGIVQQYDGKGISELGFNVYPENVSVSTSTTGGAMEAGTRSYAAVYEYYDATGNFHSSKTQITPSFTTTGTTSSASINVQTLTLTSKFSAVTISLYRTLSGGDIYYKVNQQQNDPTTNFITITDTISDATITGFLGDLQLYTTGGVVDNSAPPPSMVMGVINNRLELVDSENPTNTWWYSKTYSPGNGIAMSSFLTVTIDPRFGKITTLILMDANTVVLKEGGVFVLGGDGSDDAGQNSTFTNPQVIPSDVGCLYSRGSILTPDGVMFKTTKGIYLLGRGLSISYIGAEAEAFNSQNVEAALIAPDASQIRFLTSSGFTLVYDYIFKQWSQFSNHQGYSSTIWNGKYTYCRTDGSIFLENNSIFLDNLEPFALSLQLAWIKLAGIQGFQRVKRGMLLGDHISPVSGHGIQISAAYDYVQSFGAPVPYFPPVSASSAVLQYREMFKRMKCDSLGLIIQEITTGASGEYISLTDLSLEVGLKQGTNKISGFESVG